MNMICDIPKRVTYWSDILNVLYVFNVVYLLVQQEQVKAPELKPVPSEFVPLANTRTATFGKTAILVKNYHFWKNCHFGKKLPFWEELPFW